MAVLLFTLAASSAHAQTTDACDTREVALKCSGGTSCELVLQVIGKPGCRLRIDDAWLKAHDQPRITEETTLRIRVVGANLLRYGLKFETKEKVVDSYVDLEKLWREVLGFVPDARAAASKPVTSFIAAVDNWRRAIAKHEADIAAFIGSYKDLTLTCGDREKIGNEGRGVATRLNDLAAKRKEADDLIGQSTDLGVFAVFDATLALHDAAVGRLRAFEARAQASAEGFVRRITFGDAGRIVTVSITMNDLASGTDAGLVEIVEFFVHSTLPVTFHAGYAYSALDAFEFEPVAALSGSDLFAQINKGENTSGFVAFLSYRFGSAEKRPRIGRHKIGEWYATLGTDFKDPGKRLFVGATTRIKKVMLTGGIATASVREAADDDKVTDVVTAVGGVLGTRELFTRIRTTRQWRGFVAVSFAPF